MTTYIVNIEDGNEEAQGLIDKLIAMGIDLVKKSSGKTKETPYNEEFVEKVLQGEKDIKEGRGVKIKLEDLWK